jgi:NhaP-type Na+/H+ or K+/H+ antiporter
MSAADGPVLLAVMAAAILVWSIFSVRLERWRISGAMLFVAVGLLATNGPWRVADISLHSHTLRSVAELALAMVLFTDASRVNVHRLRDDAGVPTRLLALGLPLAVAFGMAAAALVFTGIDVWMALLVAVIVAPTDAALGAPVIENPLVPTRIRRALNVESGLNDGLATPIFTIALALAVSHGDGHGAGVATAVWAVVGGLVLGLGGGVIGGLLLRITEARGWATASLQPVAVIALPLLIYGLALAWELNGFVAAFVAGISFGATWHPSVPDRFDIAVSLAADVGGVFSAAVWLMVGAMLVPAITDVDWQAIVFAVLSLTVVRGLAVAISLVGVGFDRATVAFVAWFGPRGLASVVFALIAYDELDPGDAQFLLTVIVTVVILSVLAHGVSAGPLAERFGRSHPDPESDGPSQLPSRSFGRRRIYSETG